uniref:PorZ beta-propeller-like domain-containing protein n=2 Tax=Prevotellaceae TaxID=171552 RepID=UPI003F65B641
MKIFSLKQTINALTRSVAVSVCAVVLTLSAMMTASTVAVASTPPIGTWKSYMAYSDIRHIVKVGNRVYVVASGDLYVYDTSDESITTMDRNNGLSDTDIKFISWNAAAKRLVIVYSNGNIDLLSEKLDITNISDYYDKSLTYDKTINNVFTNGNLTYLATGFGIVVVNVSNATIADTYALQEKVNA